VAPKYRSMPPAFLLDETRRITTKTLQPAPDGKPDTRKIVGVNERVEMTFPSPATWSATGGALLPGPDSSIIWTAPDVGGFWTITAWPKAGVAASITMHTIPPRNCKQTRAGDIQYAPRLAGSGFFGNIDVEPKSVSFSRLELIEGTVQGIATGYYNIYPVLWDGALHRPADKWAKVDNANKYLGYDTVGSYPPGTPGPFQKGYFFWPIPKFYRAADGATRRKFCTANHVQVMTGESGEEITAKEGAIRYRTPKP